MGSRVRERRGSLGAGFAAIGSGRLLVLILTVATLVLAVLAAAPLGPSLKDALGGTLAGDHILNNHPSFAPTDVFDFFREKRPAVAGTAAAARLAALFALLQQILLAGGIVAVLGRGTPIELTQVVAGVRQNAWHNVKCFLIFLLAMGIALGAWFGVTQAISRKVFEPMAPGSWSAFLFRLGIALVALFLYAVLSLLHDFARAARRNDAAVGAWRAYLRARATLSGRWVRGLGIFLFWLLFGGGVLFLFISLEWSAPAATALAIAVHILIQTAVLAVRSALRVAAWGSYLSLYDGAQTLPALPIAPALPEPRGSAAVAPV